MFKQCFTVHARRDFFSLCGSEWKWKKQEQKGGGHHGPHVMETQTISWAKEPDQQREGWRKRKVELKKRSEPSDRSTLRHHVLLSLLPPHLLFECYSLLNKLLCPPPSLAFFPSFLPFIVSSHVRLFLFFLPLCHRWPLWHSFPKTLAGLKRVEQCVGFASSHSFTRVWSGLIMIQCNFEPFHLADAFIQSDFQLPITGTVSLE